MRTWKCLVAGMTTVLWLGADQNTALAQTSDMTLAGSLNAGWSILKTPGRATQDWFGSGSGVLTLSNPGLNIQANFDNEDLEIPRSGANPSLSSDDWFFGGDLFWRDYAGNTGINATFSNNTASGINGRSQSTDSLGWFGQFFALRDLTLEAKGGRTEGQNEGWYGAAGGIFYPFPNLALRIDVDYSNALHVHEEQKAAAGEAEFLPVRQIPLSIYIGYSYADFSQFKPQGVSIFQVGVRAYFGGGGREGTLVDYQRNGTTDWDGQ